MVSPDLIRTSNESIKSALPPGLVAVFAGGTNGVGETTLKQFAKHAFQPTAYILGRSPEAGDRLTAECKAINPEGTFIFVQSDMSLMRNVDTICEDIASKEKCINILFLTIGTLQSGMETKEGLHYAAALTIHARSRFISNLLPLIRQADNLRRVVTVYGATFEGPVHMERFDGWTMNRMTEMAHLASVTTLDLAAHQKTAPEVSFVHNFPGSVASGIARGSIGPLMRTLKTIWHILGSLVNIPLEEAGDRHLFLCTSARFPPAGEDKSAAGVPLCDGLELASGINGLAGSGVYSINEKGDSAGPKTEKVLAEHVRQGLVDTIRAKIRYDIECALDPNKKRQARV